MSSQGKGSLLAMEGSGGALRWWPQLSLDSRLGQSEQRKDSDGAGLY